MSAPDEPLRLGGMALRNGLLVHGPTSWAAAVRRTDGTIGTASGRKPRLRGRVTELPLARGPVRLGEAMAVIPLVKRALPEAKLPFQDVSVAGAMAAASLGGTLLRRRRGAGAGTEIAVAALSIAPSLLALRGGELAGYHGAEHQAIGGYERGEDAAEVPKEHERCGSHLMAPLLAANVAGTLLLKSVVDRPTPAHGAAVSLASVGVAVEVFAWSERHAGSRLSQALRAPGFELQRVIGTREPTDAQLEVGRAALGAVLAAEGQPAAA